MPPKDAGLRAHDGVASHRAADGAGPSIKGARTHARCISRGAVVRFRALRPAPRGSQKKLLAGSEEVIAQDGHSPPGVACGEIVLPTSRGFKYLIF
jgi:hypothetical protein